MVGALTTHDSMTESKNTLYSDERVWYDQFTSTDWVHDSIADAYRVKALRSRTDIRGKILASIDGIQGWILSALVGCLTAVLAYIVDVSESPFFDWKDGYCSQGFLISEKVCLWWISLLFQLFGPSESKNFNNKLWSLLLNIQTSPPPDE